MKNILILGSGRSGTSLLAGLFDQAGYYFGDHLHPAQEANPKGYFESADVNQVNEEILADTPMVQVPRRSSVPPEVPRAYSSSRHYWLARVSPRARVHDRPERRPRMQAMLAHEPYCLKDPRFCYTLPAWRPLLANAVFLCVFRSPAVTVASMLRNCRTSPFYWDLDLTASHAAGVWSCMYAHVLKIHRHEGDWMFLHYDQLWDGEALDRLESFTGAPIDRGFPDAALRRSAAAGSDPWSTRLTYHTLCRLAGYRESG